MLYISPFPIQNRNQPLESVLMPWCIWSFEFAELDASDRLLDGIPGKHVSWCICLPIGLSTPSSCLTPPMPHNGPPTQTQSMQCHRVGHWHKLLPVMSLQFLNAFDVTEWVYNTNCCRVRVHNSLMHLMLCLIASYSFLTYFPWST